MTAVQQVHSSAGGNCYHWGPVWSCKKSLGKIDPLWDQNITDMMIMSFFFSDKMTSCFLIRWCWMWIFNINQSIIYLQIFSSHVYKKEITKGTVLISWGSFQSNKSRSIQSNRATDYGMNLQLIERFRTTLWIKALRLFNPTSHSLLPIRTFHSS